MVSVFSSLSVGFSSISDGGSEQGGSRMAEPRYACPPPLKTEEDYIPYPSVHEVLGREGPFPLILLPQFGGYWIEGTNHQLGGTPVPSPLPAPGTRAKLECNHTAKIYRKHFLGK
ncbi:rap1 GTPase-activating protein 1, partial [Apteryx rowi]|uniref:rap1 GTPase-activating protein 1 n=1 Tax=Apteryx rowi TaxID=308060 RepID=UPI000E1DA992